MSQWSPNILEYEPLSDLKFIIRCLLFNLILLKLCVVLHEMLLVCGIVLAISLVGLVAYMSLRWDILRVMCSVLV